MLFLTLFKEFRVSLTPVLLEMVQTTQGVCNPDDMVAILRKDSGENECLYGVVSLHLYICLYLCSDSGGRTFASYAGDLGSIPGQVIPKTLKWY